MGCFCYDIIVKNRNFEGRTTTFTDIDSNDSEQYCMQWLVSYSTEIGVKYGAPLFIAVLNAFVSLIFKKIAPF